MSLAEAIVWSLVGSFASPTTFVPAIVIGCLVRSGRQAALGGAAYAVAHYLIGQLIYDLPEGAEIIWLAVPFALIPPTIWALAAFAVAGWVRRRTAQDPSHPGIRAMHAAVGAAVGMVVVGAAAIGAGIVFVEVAEVSSFEGAAGYLVFLGFGVPGIFLGLVAGAILGWRRRRPRAVTST